MPEGEEAMTPNKDSKRETEIQTLEQHKKKVMERWR